jgi:hypothetical protein
MSYPIMLCKWIRSTDGWADDLVFRHLVLPIPPAQGMGISIFPANESITFVNLYEKKDGEFLPVCWFPDAQSIKISAETYVENGWKLAADHPDMWP